jgi:hypothetical protein
MTMRRPGYRPTGDVPEPTQAPATPPPVTVTTDQQLSEDDVKTLRAHVQQHGLDDLPFGATVRRG